MEIVTVEVAGEKYECAVFDGMFFALTKDGEVEIVVTVEIAGEKYECAVFDGMFFDGMFFVLTKDGEVEIVVTAPPWKFAEVVASESYVDSKTGAEVHVVDVHTDTKSLLLFVTVEEGRITEIV